MIVLEYEGRPNNFRIAHRGQKGMNLLVQGHQLIEIIANNYIQMQLYTFKPIKPAPLCVKHTSDNPMSNLIKLHDRIN
jgi:hypothetical protein